jgi:SAM-dependent methyltransferase
LARSREISIESSKPSPEATTRWSATSLTTVADCTKRGTGTLSITRRHVRARDYLLRTEPQSNEMGTLRLRKMKTLSGLWHESSSKRFLKRIQYDPADLFDGPVLMRMRELVDFDIVKNVLSIGCGNGRFELPLLEHFPITVDFIEPSPIMFEQLGKNLKRSKGPGKAGVLFNGQFEEFSIEKQYDFIFGIHSFYFTENAVICAQKAAQLLNSTGHLAIVLHARDGFGRRLICEFDHAGRQGGATAEWLYEQLSDSWELSFIESHLPYNNFVEGDGLSAHGQAFVAFYAYRDWRTFAPAEKLRARKIIEEHSDGGIIREKFGVLHFRNN